MKTINIVYELCILTNIFIDEVKDQYFHYIDLEDNMTRKNFKKLFNKETLYMYQTQEKK